MTTKDNIVSIVDNENAINQLRALSAELTGVFCAICECPALDGKYDTTTLLREIRSLQNLCFKSIREMQQSKEKESK